MGDLDDAEFDAWVAEQRSHVEYYLTAHGIENPTVGPWPAFEVAPKFAIWAVESKEVSGRIGWWAFSGDCPTDYIAEDGQRHPRAALRRQLDAWRTYVSLLKRDEQPTNTRFDGDLPELGELLSKRVEILAAWVEDDDMWEDQ